MWVLYAITGVLFGFSVFANRRKTVDALGVALRRFVEIVPAFIVMLALVSISLYLVPDRLLAEVLASDNKWVALASALVLGSVSIMPGFIAYPLCGILLSRGALYMVLSGFSTTLMMVGIVTFPLEKAYLGTRLALSRNVVSFAIAVLVAVVTGLYFKELP